jgi:hypothetical protein
MTGESEDGDAGLAEAEGGDPGESPFASGSLQRRPQEVHRATLARRLAEHDDVARLVALPGLRRPALDDREGAAQFSGSQLVWPLGHLRFVLPGVPSGHPLRARPTVSGPQLG